MAQEKEFRYNECECGGDGMMMTMMMMMRGQASAMHKVQETKAVINGEAQYVAVAAHKIGDAV